MGCGSSSAAGSADDNSNKQPTKQPPRQPTPEKKLTTPEKKQTTPEKKQTTPENKQTTPEKKQTTPENKQTTPEKKQQPQEPPPTKANTDSRVNDFVKEAVEHHNKLRAMHDAPPMVAADDLIQYSQNWANDIAKRDKMEHSKCTLPSGGRVGENIYCFWSSDPSATASATSAVQAWYDEIKDYNFNNPGFAMNTGHFTQVVWKGSTELGIAWAQASGGRFYVVANYRTAGNMMGDFPNNVLPKS